MAAMRRYPLRIYENVEAACSRERAGMLAGGTDVSTVTKVWLAVAGGGSSVTVVSFVLRTAPSRRERRQSRKEERTAPFRARPRGDLAVEDARAAGPDYARDLLAFVGMSAEAEPFVPLAESVEVQEAAKALAERIISRGEDSLGIALTSSLALYGRMMSSRGLTPQFRSSGGGARGARSASPHATRTHQPNRRGSSGCGDLLITTRLPGGSEPLPSGRLTHRAEATHWFS